MKGTKLMSHYKFCKKVILGKVCPRKHDSLRRRRLLIVFQRENQKSQAARSNSKRLAASVASKDGTVSKKHKAAVYVTTGQVANGLSFFRGMRLDQTLCHLPVAATELETNMTRNLRVQCAVGQWENNTEHRHHIVNLSTLFSVCGATRLST